MARRVLPMPAVPAMVTNRTSGRRRSSRIAAISYPRPTSWVAWDGRPLERSKPCIWRDNSHDPGRVYAVAQLVRLEAQLELQSMAHGYRIKAYLGHARLDMAPFRQHVAMQCDEVPAPALVEAQRGGVVVGGG